MVSLISYSFQVSKRLIEVVSFFLDTNYFWWRTQNFGSILNQRQSNPLFSTLIQYGTEIWKIVAVSFFLDTATLWKKILRFDPTLNSHNSGSKHRSIENHHIFRFVRTSAFTWCSPCRVYEIRMSRKCGKHEKIPFFRFLSVTTVKKSWRPAFGQFWCYRTSPWLILTDITHIFDGY